MAKKRFHKRPRPSQATDNAPKAPTTTFKDLPERALALILRHWDLEQVIDCVSIGPNFFKPVLSITKGRGYNPQMLETVIRKKHRPLIDALLTQANIKGWDQAFALHYATRRGFTLMVQLLLDRGADIDAVNKEGLTPIMVARGPDTTAALLSKNPNLSRRNAKYDQTTLHAAAATNNLLLAKTILDRLPPEETGSKVTINKGDVKGRTALHMAVDRKSFQVAELLCERGAEVDKEDEDGCTPLLLARSTELLRLLVEHGSDLTKASPKHGSVLHVVALPDISADDIAEKAMEEGVDVDIQATHRSFSHQTALHMAVRNSKTALIGLLIDFGADVNLHDIRGDTPLHVASYNSKNDYMQLLLDAGSDKTLVNKKDQTPMERAKTRKAEAAFDDFEVEKERQAKKERKTMVLRQLEAARNTMFAATPVDAPAPAEKTRKSSRKKKKKV